ncbi:unnamed protein product [Protopolystoma xenopodis]|uniref:Uncharacterized protein n=1 Tax=Protopolystoma xenopodis TaxID=117903 RepID=A0A448X886_9PLAT|nr:unnamed protein product [Protopolystoma xenopodis]
MFLLDVGPGRATVKPDRGSRNQCCILCSQWTRKPVCAGCGLDTASTAVRPLSVELSKQAASLSRLCYQDIFSTSSLNEL